MGETSTMTWEPLDLPPEGTFTLEGTNGSVDMRTNSSSIFEGDGELTIKYKLFPSSIDDFKEVAYPEKFMLSQNYPNPFNPQTFIQFQIPSETRVIVKIFNILGHEINTLNDGIKPAGIYQVIWDGSNSDGEKVTSGVYIYRIQAGEFIKSKKMILLQ